MRLKPFDHQTHRLRPLLQYTSDCVACTACVMDLPAKGKGEMVSEKEYGFIQVCPRLALKVCEVTGSTNASILRQIKKVAILAAPNLNIPQLILPMYV